MRIAFDLDGVLADLEAALGVAADEMYGPAQPPPAADASPSEDAEAGPDGVPSPDNEPMPPRFEQLGPADQRRLWRQVLDTENFWETLDEIEPGIIARLSALSVERGWEVIFVTQRPPSAGDTCQRQTQRWLAARGFDLPSVFVLRGSRGAFAAALDLDVVVDDRPQNCLDVVLESKARSILVWRGDMSEEGPANAARLKIEVVRSVAECLDRLAGEPRGAGLFERLKRLISP